MQYFQFTHSLASPDFAMIHCAACFANWLFARSGTPFPAAPQAAGHASTPTAVLPGPEGEAEMPGPEGEAEIHDVADTDDELVEVSDSELIRERREAIERGDGAGWRIDAD